MLDLTNYDHTSVCLLRCNLYMLHCQDCDRVHEVRMRSQISPSVVAHPGLFVLQVTLHYMTAGA